ncbi:MAG: prohibitin family protein [Saprospiraceae bacterium]|nr:prohibitin family protein [Saprospiraceae bacterium]MCB0573211.1 prohibitin family protein [Saprospiraceae bacterium]MCB9356735.1 prohibitin family protein [Lewinellaceae bacterium]
MFLAILGLLIIAATATVAKANPNWGNIGKTGRLTGTVLVLLGLSTACFVQIQPGEVGVQTLFGKIQSNVLTEGLNIINPLVEVQRFDVKTQNYTMSAVRDEGVKVGDDAIRVLTGDGLEVVIDLSVLYHIIPDRAPEILRTIGRGVTDKIVRPVSRTKIRDNAVFYDAVALYSTKRDEFQQKIYTTIEKEFQTRGIILEAILIRNITLPESVRQTIESKINAEQEAQKMKFILDKERQEADRKRVEAQGIADYQRILTSTLTDRLLQYEQIKAQKEIATSPNSKVVVMGSGKTAPILIGQ